jgi:CheY-like chemotaxis protein
MKKDVHILIADDDRGHVNLIQKNLRRWGITNPIVHFKDGLEVLDFLFKKQKNNPSHNKPDSYLLLLDIRMPKMDGIKVLQRIKQDPELKKIPIIMLSTTDDPLDIGQCHYFGCSTYIIKPIQYDKFVEAIRILALFLNVIEVPSIKVNVKDNPGIHISKTSGLENE